MLGRHAVIVEFACPAPNGFIDAVLQWTDCRRHELHKQPMWLVEQLVWSALWLPVLPVLYVLGRRLRCLLRAPWGAPTRD